MNPFQRRYMKDIIRVQEIERRLGMIETHLTSREVPFAEDSPPSHAHPPVSIYLSVSLFLSTLFFLSLNLFSQSVLSYLVSVPPHFGGVLWLA
jgi:hypothetical protein